MSFIHDALEKFKAHKLEAPNKADPVAFTEAHENEFRQATADAIHELTERCDALEGKVAELEEKVAHPLVSVNTETGEVKMADGEQS